MHHCPQALLITHAPGGRDELGVEGALPFIRIPFPCNAEQMAPRGLSVDRALAAPIKSGFIFGC